MTVVKGVLSIKMKIMSELRYFSHRNKHHKLKKEQSN